MQTTNLADLYGLAPLDWATVENRLAAAVSLAPDTGGPNRHSTWLSTINPDGSPHVTGIGAMWRDGAFWFVTGATSRKGRNVARDPRCALSVAVHDFDVVIEGEARQVTDPPTVAAIAAMYAANGWPCEVDESGTALTAPFSAPSAGPPPWHVYRLDARRANALSTTEPGGASRFDF